MSEQHGTRGMGGKEKRELEGRWLQLDPAVLVPKELREYRAVLCPAWLPEVKGHFWLVNVDVTVEMPEFFEAHREAEGGMVWAVCRDCGKPWQGYPENAPVRGRAVLPLFVEKWGREREQTA